MKGILANPGMDWRYFSVTPWVQSIALDAGDGIVLAEVIETGCALGAGALGAPLGLHHAAVSNRRYDRRHPCPG